MLLNDESSYLCKNRRMLAYKDNIVVELPKSFTEADRYRFLSRRMERRFGIQINERERLASTVSYYFMRTRLCEQGLL